MMATSALLYKQVAEVKRLSSFDLHESAVLLASFCVSQCSNEQGISRALAKCAFGNALKQDHQFKRAIQMYKDAVHEVSRAAHDDATVDSHQTQTILLLFEDDHNVLRGQTCKEDENLNTSNNNEEEGDSSKRRRRCETSLMLTNSIKFRIALCYAALKQDDDAIQVLDQVKPAEDLPGAALALLANLKHKKRVHDRGLLLYRAAIRKEPFALESILKLVDMEVPLEDILQDVGSEQQHETWIKAHCAAAQHNTTQALDLFSQLNNSSSSSHVLTNMAKLELQRGNREHAMDLFTRARQIDPLNLDSADIYASLLRGFGDSKRLVQLTHELLSMGAAAAARPEPWIASALLAEMGDDREKALKYSVKALECDPIHLPALHFRSALLLALNRPLESLSSCSIAFTLKRDFNGSKGLVDAYLALHRPLDAIAIAQEAVSLMQHDVRVYVLLAKALFSPASHDRLDLACATLAHALALDQDYLPATMLLADVRAAQFKLGACTAQQVVHTAKLMKRALHVKPGVNAVNNRDVLHCKIGMLFVLVDDHISALEHFNDALSWNPHCAEALETMESLELLTKPAAPRMQQQQHSVKSTPMTSLKRSPPPAFRLMMSARGRDSM